LRGPRPSEDAEPSLDSAEEFLNTQSIQDGYGYYIHREKHSDHRGQRFPTKSKLPYSHL